MTKFTERVEAGLAHLTHISVGACPGCAGCGIPTSPFLPTDEQRLTGCTVNGYPIRWYDDGYGPLWIVRESLGPIGVIRAESWEAAYEIAADCIFDDISEEEFLALAREEDPDLGAEDWPDFAPDACGFRPNGEPSDNGLHSPFYQIDPNGSTLDTLTPELAESLSVELTWSPTADDLQASADYGIEFTWSGCEVCGSRFGGERQYVHGIDADNEIRHLEACIDCYLYIANGDEPEESDDE